MNFSMGDSLKIKTYDMTRNLIIQEYIPNPILYNGNKVDFRMYVVITSLAPIQIYFIDYFFVRRCSLPFNTTEKLAHICNLGLAENKVDNLFLWNFKDLSDQLIQQGYANSSTFDHTVLLNQMKSKIAHMINSGLSSLTLDHR